MFKKNLLYIESEIKNVSGTDVMEMSVKTKLNKSLEKYSKNLEETCKYLLSQNVSTIINFLQKDKEKKQWIV